MAISLLEAAVVLCLARLGLGDSSWTNSWAVQIQSGGKEAADALASKYGLINFGQVGNLKNVYHFVMSMHHDHNHFELKRSVDGFSEVRYLSEQLQAEYNVGYVKQQERRMLQKKGYDIPNDPNWSDQWSLLNTGQLNSTDVGNDLNVERAWLQGVTGCGSVVAIVDDGVEYTHSDLVTNYISSIQNDFLDHDTDPFPATRGGVREAHGTRCAGVIGMEKGDGICGVGVAYNSFITGLRLISEPGPTDLDEAEALSWENDVIDIYSNGWGPEDNGTTVAGPGHLLQMAMEMSIKNGRQGKGSIYVFAAGNGGTMDTCAADGYTNSIYTISVGSAASSGRQSSFDEVCSAKMVVTFDSDPYQDKRHVVTTDVEDSCCNDFFETSASTSLVSGVLALLLEVNPDLTWRDVQHLIAYTSSRNNLVGLQMELVSLSVTSLDLEPLTLRLLSREEDTGSTYHLSYQTISYLHLTLLLILMGVASAAILPGEGETVSVAFFVEPNITSLEHVVMIFNMHFVDIKLPHYEHGLDRGQNVNLWPERGSVQVDLTSPSGTTSTLLPLRPGDVLPGCYEDWPLMSVHFWGESPAGDWLLTVTYTGNVGSIRVEVPRVTFYGTSKVPQAVSRTPAECSPECDSTRGCAAIGAEFCDACAQLRIASTLECTSYCPEGLIERNGYCYNTTHPETSCNSANPTEEPPWPSLTTNIIVPSSMGPSPIIFPTASSVGPSSTIFPTTTNPAEPTRGPRCSAAAANELNMWLGACIMLALTLLVPLNL